MARTRITYQDYLLTLPPQGFPEWFESAYDHTTGPRLSPRSKLWEPKARPLWILYLAPLSWSCSHCRNLFVSNFSIFPKIRKISQSCVLPPGHAGDFHQDHCQMVRHVLILEMPKSHEVFKSIEERFYPYTQAVGDNRTNHLLLMTALSQ